MTAAVQDAFGIAATLVGLYGYIPYIRGIRRGETTPHVFSWLLWGLSAAITFAVQLSAQGGPGAWAAGVTMFATFFIAGWSFRWANRTISASDWVALVLSLATLPLWYFTGNPLYAISLLSINELFAFYPTFRKSWSDPHGEVLQIYFFGAIMYALSLFAMTDLSPTTALYPLTIVTTNSVFIFVVWRRRLNAGNVASP